MEKITKKDIRAIRGGNHAKLMDCLDFLLDSYEEDKWDLGYGACLADMSVRAQRLAEYIGDMATKYGNRGNDEINYLTVEQTAKAIEDYFLKEQTEI